MPWFVVHKMKQETFSRIKHNCINPSKVMTPIAYQWSTWKWSFVTLQLQMHITWKAVRQLDNCRSSYIRALGQSSTINDKFPFVQMTESSFLFILYLHGKNMYSYLFLLASIFSKNFFAFMAFRVQNVQNLILASYWQLSCLSYPNHKKNNNRDGKHIMV